jgi:photosystem II stability/assembly factor-like uncharacterized protein
MRLFRIAIGLSLVLPGTALAQWTQAGNGLNGSVPGVTALVVDGATGSTLYALTSANSVFKVFKSIDGGANWKALGNIAGANVLALDPNTASTIYAGTARGVMTSTDGGASWASTGLQGTSIGVLAIDPIAPSTLYAGGNGHLYKSLDRGGSWTDLNISPPPNADGRFIAALVLDPFTPSTLYVALGKDSGGSFLKSLDGGKTWNVIYAAGPFYSTSSNLVIDPSNPSTLYRINPLLKSTDGGMSWSPTGFNDSGFALAVDPSNSNTLYLSTGRGLFKSTDGGQNWNALDATIPPAGSFVFSPDSNSVYAATRGGVFRSTDAGLDWRKTNTGLRVMDLEVLVGDPLNPATIYAGGNDGLFKSEDSGECWSHLGTFQVTSSTTQFPAVSPGGVRSLLIDFTNPAVLYVSLARSVGNFWTSTDINLVKSTDGGATWNYSIGADVTPTTGNAVGLLAVDPRNPSTLYLKYGNDYEGYVLRKTNDGGANWSYTGLGALNGLNALVIDPTTPASLYAATASTSPLGDSVIGGVQQSTDGGANWNVVGLANQDVGLLAIDPLHPYVLYAVVTGPNSLSLFKSTDSGASWSPINSGLDDVVNTRTTVNALIVDPDHPKVLYLGTSGYGVFKSSDGGATWAAFNDGLTFPDVRALAIVRGTTTVYASTPGGVFKIREEGQ